jgi:hypothetical protein
MILYIHRGYGVKQRMADGYAEETHEVQEPERPAAMQDQDVALRLFGTWGYPMADLALTIILQ